MGVTKPLSQNHRINEPIQNGIWRKKESKLDLYLDTEWASNNSLLSVQASLMKASWKGLFDD